MTKEQKLTASIAILPSIADLLEDCEGMIGKALKVRIKNMISQIRTLDSKIMDSADKWTIEQQIDIQRAFRQFLTKGFE